MSRILTGDRPTGALHLGHYFGTLAQRVQLQRDGHQILIVIADYQVITDRDRSERLYPVVEAMIADYLACGLDPSATTIFTHSAVPELNQLVVPFLSLVSQAELNRNPTVKEEIQHSRQGGVNALMLTYPVHQAADILAVGGTLVPVGRDQLPHLELTRTIARRFNDRYGRVFELPQALLSEQPMVCGLDGAKMGKSRGNSIPLTAGPDDVARLVRAAPTDCERLITYEPDRRRNVSALLELAGACAGREPGELAAQIGYGGAGELKAVLIESVNQVLAPIHDRRRLLDRREFREALRRGNALARARAEHTLDAVRAVMGMDYRSPHGRLESASTRSGARRD
jgi:tryptophanyl-tRNA synthetase